MNKITLLLAVLAFSFTNAQTPTIQWQKNLGGTDTDSAKSVIQTLDGGYVVAGYAYSNDKDVKGNHGGFDFWVVKLDVKGTIQWQKTLGGISTDYAYSIQQTKDRGYIVAGYSSSWDGDVTDYHGGGGDFWVVKLDEIGNLQWQKALGGPCEDYALSVQQTMDGGYILCGITCSTDGDVTGNHGGIDYWVVKLDTLGTMQWQKTLGGTSNDIANSIKQTTDGGYIVVGCTDSTDGDVVGNHSGNQKYDSWVVKLDEKGTLQWQKALGGSKSDYAQSVQQTTDGGYIVAGNTTSSDGDVTVNHGESDFWVVKLGAFGVLEWQKSLGGIGDDFATSVQQTNDGGYIVAGSTYSFDGDVTGYKGLVDFWVVKLNAKGTLKWQKTLGGKEQDNCCSAQLTSDGGYILAGNTGSKDGDVTANYGGGDFWVVKLSPEVLDTENFSLNNIAIYPNPAATNINIEVGNNTIIEKVVITDLMGKIILQETQNTKTIVIENLAQGMYLLNAYSGEQKMVSKFVKQ